MVMAKQKQRKGKKVKEDIKKQLETVKEKLKEIGNHMTIVSWFHQSKNKRARIISNSTAVTEKVLVPIDWNTRWPDFYEDVVSYKREGKNAHDDAPDMLTGIVENIERTIDFLR